MKFRIIKNWEGNYIAQRESKLAEGQWIDLAEPFPTLTYAEMCIAEARKKNHFMVVKEFNQ